MYMEWVKPYIRNIRRLQLYENNMNRAELVNAFESQIIEVETLFIRDDFGKNGKKGHMAAVVSMHLFFRVKPELSFHSYEYQNKGPIYTGMADITLRAYAWSHDKIAKYKKYRQDDDLDLLKSIDDSVAAAMDALGDELKRYLKEADPSLVFSGDVPPPKLVPKTQGYPDVLDPFVSIFKGFADIAKGFTGGVKKGPKEAKKKKEGAKEKFAHYKEHHRVEHFAAEAAFESYLRYKMGPGGNIYWIEP